MKVTIAQLRECQLCLNVQRELTLLVEVIYVLNAKKAMIAKLLMVLLSQIIKQIKILQMATTAMELCNTFVHQVISAPLLLKCIINAPLVHTCQIHS